MLIETECLPCLIKQLVRLIKIADVPEEKAVAISRDLLRELLQEDIASLSPPAVGRLLNTIFINLTGIPDPYRDVKKKSNDIAMEILEREINAANSTGDPLEAAIKYSILGNVIDYGGQYHPGEEYIYDSFRDIEAVTLDKPTYDLFKEEIRAAEKILIIGDNAGEIVFDKFMIEKMPAEKIIYVVRGGPIINDATMDDAGYIGLKDIVRVIDTGDNTPGVDFDRSGDEFVNEFGNADMIILKGQGNFETLFNEDVSDYKKSGVPMYFLFKAKCGPAARIIGCGVNEYQFLRRE